MPPDFDYPIFIMIQGIFTLFFSHIQEFAYFSPIYMKITNQIKEVEAQAFFLLIKDKAIMAVIL